MNNNNLEQATRLQIEQASQMGAQRMGMVPVQQQLGGANNNMMNNNMIIGGVANNNCMIGGVANNNGMMNNNGLMNNNGMNNYQLEQAHHNLIQRNNELLPTFGATMNNNNIGLTIGQQQIQKQRQQQQNIETQRNYALQGNAPIINMNNIGQQQQQSIDGMRGGGGTIPSSTTMNYTPTAPMNMNTIGQVQQQQSFPSPNNVPNGMQYDAINNMAQNAQVAQLQLQHLKEKQELIIKEQQNQLVLQREMMGGGQQVVGQVAQVGLNQMGINGIQGTQMGVGVGGMGSVPQIRGVNNMNMQGMSIPSTNFVPGMNTNGMPSMNENRIPSIIQGIDANGNHHPTSAIGNSANLAYAQSKALERMQQQQQQQTIINAALNNNLNGQANIMQQQMGTMNVGDNNNMMNGQGKMMVENGPMPGSGVSAVTTTNPSNNTTTRGGAGKDDINRRLRQLAQMSDEELLARSVEAAKATKAKKQEMNGDNSKDISSAEKAVIDEQLDDLTKKMKKKQQEKKEQEKKEQEQKELIKQANQQANQQASQDSMIEKFLTMVITRVPEISSGVSRFLPSAGYDPTRNEWEPSNKRDFKMVMDTTLIELRGIYTRNSMVGVPATIGTMDLLRRVQDCINAIEPYQGGMPTGVTNTQGQMTNGVPSQMMPGMQAMQQGMQPGMMPQQNMMSPEGMMAAPQLQQMPSGGIYGQPQFMPSPPQAMPPQTMVPQTGIMAAQPGMQQMPGMFGMPQPPLMSPQAAMPPQVMPPMNHPMAGGVPMHPMNQPTGVHMHPHIPNYTQDMGSMNSPYRQFDRMSPYKVGKPEPDYSKDPRYSLTPIPKHKPFVEDDDEPIMAQFKARKKAAKRSAKAKRKRLPKLVHRNNSPKKAKKDKEIKVPSILLQHSSSNEEEEESAVSTPLIADYLSSELEKKNSDENNVDSKEEEEKKEENLSEESLRSYRTFLGKKDTDESNADSKDEDEEKKEEEEPSKESKLASSSGDPQEDKAASVDGDTKASGENKVSVDNDKEAKEGLEVEEVKVSILMKHSSSNEEEVAVPVHADDPTDLSSELEKKNSDESNSDSKDEKEKKKEEDGPSNEPVLAAKISGGDPRDDESAPVDRATETKVENKVPVDNDKEPKDDSSTKSEEDVSEAPSKLNKEGATADDIDLLSKEILDSKSNPKEDKPNEDEDATQPKTTETSEDKPKNGNESPPTSDSTNE